MPSVPVDLLTPAVLDVLARLAVDVVALTALLGLLTLRRRGGHDLVVACASFNVGLFAVAQVISGADLGLGAGFGLFAVLSIIRLRSELFSNTQLAYVFAVLALALATGIPGVPVAAGALLSLLIVGALAVVDAGQAKGATSCSTVTLDKVHPDRTQLVAELEARLHLEVVDLKVLDVDLVRETTKVEVTSRPLSSAEVQRRASMRVEQL